MSANDRPDEDPRCADCGGEAVVVVGPLPAAEVFAGRPVVPSLDGGRLCRCMDCHLLFRDPVLADEDYDRLYDNDSVSAWSLRLRTDQRRVREHLVAHVGGGRVLDFGCYTGQFLCSLPPGIERFGVEVNLQAAERARSSAGATVLPGLDGFDPAMQFDAIVCMDVIEHFQSPRALLQRLLARVRPGGLLLITTGDADAPLWRRIGHRWWYCAFAEHLAFISGRWLRHHLPAAGGDLVRCEAFNYLDEGLLRRAARWGYLGVGVLGLGMSVVADHLFRGRVAGVSRWRARSLPGIGLSADHLFIAIRRGALRPEDRPPQELRHRPTIS